MLNKILALFSKMVFGSAKVAVATTSISMMCQPEEPKF